MSAFRDLSGQRIAKKGPRSDITAQSVCLLVTQKNNFTMGVRKSPDPDPLSCSTLLWFSSQASFSPLLMYQLMLKHIFDIS